MRKRAALLPHMPKTLPRLSRRTTESALDATQLILSIVSGFADGVFVPGLKGAVDTASIIVDLVQVSCRYILIMSYSLTLVTSRP